MRASAPPARFPMRPGTGGAWSTIVIRPMELFVESLPFPMVVAAHLPGVQVEGRPPGDVVELRFAADDPRAGHLVPGTPAILLFDDGSEREVAISLRWSAERSGCQRLLLTDRLR